MKLEIFSIFDSKAVAFITPFFLTNRQTAVRAVKDCTAVESHAFARNPSDYVLYHIGSFDDATGHILAFAQPVVLGSAASFAQPEAFDFMGYPVEVGGHE